MFRRGVLAADGGLLERRPVPQTPAGHRGAQPAEHHGPDVQLRLQAEEWQPGGLELNTQSQEEDTQQHSHKLTHASPSGLDCF